MSRTRPLRSTGAWIGAGSFAVAVLAMAIDHLVGTEDDGEDGLLADPLTFAVSVAVSGAAALVLFAWLVPRATSSGPPRAATTGLISAIGSVAPGIALLWLGVPFVTAGAGVALGLEGRRGERRRQAIDRRDWRRPGGPLPRDGALRLRPRRLTGPTCESPRHG